MDECESKGNIQGVALEVEMKEPGDEREECETEYMKEEADEGEEEQEEQGQEGEEQEEEEEDNENAGPDMESIRKGIGKMFFFRKGLVPSSNIIKN